MVYHYRIFGLRVASALACPELVPAAPDDGADVRILRRRLPPLPGPLLPPGGQSGGPVRPAAPRPRVEPGIYRFDMPEVARYRVEQGCRILVDAAPGAAAGDVRLWLLGTALGALLHQRGLLPLHVSALVAQGEASAFCGVSGAGKSTLAAALHARGLPLLTDDVALAVPEAGRTLLYPGFPRIKLWRDALMHFGMEPGRLPRDLSRTEKFHLKLQERFESTPRPLGRVYLLERDRSGGAPRIEALRGVEAIQVIRANTYRPALIERMGRQAAHLQACAQLARQVPVFRFTRPWSLARMDESLERLLAHMRAPLAA